MSRSPAERHTATGTTMRRASCGTSRLMRCLRLTSPRRRIARLRWCSDPPAPHCTCRPASRSSSSPPAWNGLAPCASHPAAMCSSRKALPADVRILRTAAGTSRPQTTVFADGLTYPFGIAFWPPGPEPRFVYVAETDRVIRFPYRAGDLRPRGKPDIVVPRLPSRRPCHARSGVLARRPHDVRLGRFGEQHRNQWRGRTCRRAGIRCRWRQPAHLRHRPAQLHGARRSRPRPARCGAW